ncbi:MAG: glycosyltransferase family 2 protein [Rhodoglobus sp.]
MQPRVIAVLVALNGAQYLPRTLAAVAAQTRRPDATVYVDSGSSDSSARLLTEAGPSTLVTTPGRRSFGDAVAHALKVMPPATSDDEWLWLLGHDNAPEPTALAALLGAVEVAPSVAVAGPKLMRLDDNNVIASFGETLTPYGRSVSLVEDELDQAQHDLRSDLLAVAAGGMLVRRTVWLALGGFDPALPSVDAALDFSVRARLAGHRIIGVPTARVTSAGPPELFGRRTVSVGARNRIRRYAQLHRRLSYSPALALPLQWLSLMPLAVLRSLGHVLAKRPGAIVGEFVAAFRVAWDGSIPSARATLSRNRLLGWPAVDALRMPWAQLRERRANERAVGASTAPRVGPGFFLGGGAWVVLLAALAGAIAFGRFLDAPAVTGGALLPLSSTVGELWSHSRYGWRDIASGFTGAADPFTVVLAVLGSLTFWSPSLSIVILYLLALPLAAATAWFCAAYFARRAWSAIIVAVAWAVAPPFLASLLEGHLGAVIAHILLPTLVLTMMKAARSWAMAALAALVFAVVVASAPILTPALVLGVIAWMVLNPRAVLRLTGIPIPAVALGAPLVVEQFIRGNPLALAAEPGVPTAGISPSGLHLALGDPAASLSGWGLFLAPFGSVAGVAPMVVAVLLAPLALLSLLSLFVPGTRRSVPAMVLALLGFVTAVTGSHIAVTVIGSGTTPVWVGAALSVYWLGLLGATAVTLDSVRQRVVIPALAVALSVITLAVPSLTAATAGATSVQQSNGRLLPAFASAEAASRPWLGTLQLTAQADGGIAATLHRGLGTTLDEQSTLAATDTRLGEEDARLATLAGNIASRSGFDLATELDELQIAFVLLPDTSVDSAKATHRRATEALDGNRIFTPIGSTPNGYLWNYRELAPGAAPTGPSVAESSRGIWIGVVQGVIVAWTLVLAIPTTRRRRLRAVPVTASRFRAMTVESGTEKSSAEGSTEKGTS